MAMQGKSARVNEYNISKSVINDIVKNRLWVHV